MATAAAAQLGGPPPASWSVGESYTFWEGHEFREGEVVVVKLPARSSSSGVTALAVITKAAEHEYDVSVGAAGRVAGLTAAKLGKIHWQARAELAAASLAQAASSDVSVRSFHPGSPIDSEDGEASVEAIQRQEVQEMFLCKRSWASKGQPKHVPNNSDHFSMSRAWMAVMFNGCKTVYKFDTGPLMQAETRVTMPPSKVLAKGVDLVAIWLDMGSRYKPDVEIHREDFTMALESISLVPCDDPDSPLLHHSFLGGDAVQVWDARNVVIVDVRNNSTQVLAVPIHNFNKAGKTKRWEFEWNKSEYIYPDKRIANRFNAAGEWVGTGSGIHGGIYRWYGSSKTIEQVLAKVADGREEGVSESAVSMASGSSSSGSSTIQMLRPQTSVSRPPSKPTKTDSGGRLPPSRPGSLAGPSRSFLPVRSRAGKLWLMQRQPSRVTRRPISTTASAPRRVAFGRRPTLVAASSEPEAPATTSSGSVDNGTFRVKLSAQEAKKAVVLGQVVKEGQQLIFVSAVGINSASEEAGVVPGQVLRAISHPTDKGELWNITGTERLRYVRDAIGIRRPGEELELLLEREPYVTADDVNAAEGPTENDTAPATPAPLMGMPERERDDLYSDNWDGDEYKGSNFNELTVGLGIAIATPVIGLLIAAATYGKLWGTSGYAYLGF